MAGSQMSSNQGGRIAQSQANRLMTSGMSSVNGLTQTKMMQAIGNRKTAMDQQN